MHPVQEHTNTLGIDCSIQRPTEYIYKYQRNSIHQFHCGISTGADGLVVWASA